MNARHPGAVTARYGSKQRPRAARAQAARAGGWWRWLDSNGVTFSFVQQYDRGMYLLLTTAAAVRTAAVYNIWYGVGVVSVSYEKNETRVFAVAAQKSLHSYKEVEK